MLFCLWVVKWNWMGMLVFLVFCKVLLFFVFGDIYCYSFGINVLDWFG